MGVELIIVARTDALSAAFIDSDIDPIDHPYIVGMVEGGEEMTFPEAGVYYITRQFPEGEMRDKRLQHWNETCTNLSLNQAKQFAESLGFKLEFDWDACRSYEGFFKLKGNVEYCVKRGVQYSQFADMLWMETPKPEISVAKEFADGVHAENPNVMLAYNLSPSFNWDSSGMTD